ncbi:MAG: TonB-dependent receptor [bacterium]
MTKNKKPIICLKNSIIIIGLFILFPVLLSAVPSGINGKIIDSATGEALQGATVRLLNSYIGAYADNDGMFSIGKITPGSYELLVTMVGYDSKKIKIKVPLEKALEIELTTQPIQTGEIVVTANRRVQEVQDVPISISIVKSDDIMADAGSSMKTVLAYVPGVEVNNDNLSIRGSSGFSFGVGSRALLMVDGLPMVSADDGSMNFDIVPSFAVNQIEIIKGAGSALYGTGALGGIINILTKEPQDKSSIQVRLNSGFYTKPRFKQWEYSKTLNKSYSADLAYETKLKDVAMLFSLNALRDESWRKYDDQTRLNAFGKLAFNISNKSKLNLLLNYQTGDRADWVYWNSLDSATRPPTSTDLNQRFLSNKTTAAINYNYIINENNFIIVRSSAFYKKFWLNLDETSPDYRNSNSFSLDNDIQYNSVILENLIFTGGISYVYNNVASRNYGNHNQNITSAYAQFEYTPITPLILTFGCRGDIESADTLENNKSISPKLGVSYKIGENFALRASSGFGFRAPSVAERFASINFQGFEVIPNYDLVPEKSISYEVGFNWKILSALFPLEIDASFFQNDMSDLIEPGFITSGKPQIMFANVSKVRILGTELGVRTLLFGAVGLETGLTYMDPRDLSTNEFLKYRSKYVWYNKLSIKISDFSLSMDYRYKSKVETYDSRLNLEIKNADAYVPVHIVDLRLFYDLPLKKPTMKIGIICNNLLDYYYTEMVGNLGMTRKILLQLETKL